MVAAESRHLESEPLRDGGVGRTCLLIAAWRAAEAEEIDPLFVDPIANIFIDPPTERWVAEITRASVSTRALIHLRTRYFDERLTQELERGVKQVVLLGAGLDTRSLRLGLDDVSFFEIDSREVLSFKRESLERHGYANPSRHVAADYIKDDFLALLESAGFRRDRETCFIWEGNVMYIPADDIRGLLRLLKARLPRFRISFDYLSEELIRRRTGFSGAENLVAGFKQIGAPWVTGFADIRALADAAGLSVLDNKWMVDVVPPSPTRPVLSRELFQHYSVCTLSSHA